MLAVLTAASTGALVVANAVPASASSGPGLGAFIGFETAPDSTLIPLSALCAEFNPGGAFGPLVESLTLTGTFNGSTVPLLTGTATFTSTSAKYDASPIGTFADGSSCVGAPFTVPGTLSINMGTVNCSTSAGSAGYLRTAASVVVMTGSCGGVNMTLTGVEEPCIAVLDPCPILGSDALLQGAYVQT